MAMTIMYGPKAMQPLEGLCKCVRVDGRPFLAVDPVHRQAIDEDLTYVQDLCADISMRPLYLDGEPLDGGL
jgi:hypothetical protein